jgi:hypothetical protein
MEPNLITNIMSDVTKDVTTDITKDVTTNITTNIASDLIKNITPNHVITGAAILMFFIFYFFIGHMLNWIQYLSELLIFSIAPFKIAMHLFSSDTELKNIKQEIENMKNNDINQIKELHKKSKKIIQDRVNYGSALLKQILIVSIVRIIITLMSILNFIPFMGLFSIYIRVGLLIFIGIVQIPTTIINILISFGTNLFGLDNSNNDYYVTESLSNNIIQLIKNTIGESSLNSIKIIHDLIIKYENNDTFDSTDKEKIIKALNNIRFI